MKNDPCALVEFLVYKTSHSGQRALLLACWSSAVEQPQGGRAKVRAWHSEGF